MSSQSQSSTVTEAPVAEPAKNAWFPMGYKESFSQWYASGSPDAAEHSLLSLIPFIKPPSRLPTSPSSEQVNASQKDPHGNRSWSTQLVHLEDSKMSINEFTVNREVENHTNTLVMVHGYGAGLGFYFKNYEPLSRDPDWKLYSLDLPGMGRSERAKPPFRTGAATKNIEESITQTENWFVDAIEEWRKTRGIDRFTLLGHSMGGYLSVAYCLRYPGHVEKLILASPVGVPISEHASIQADGTAKSTSPNNIDKNKIQATADVIEGELRPSVKDRLPGNSRSTSPSASKDPDAASTPTRQIPKWVSYLWNSNVSPFSFIRATGPFGPRLVSGWTSRRFTHLTDSEVSTLHTYAYNIFRLPGSGEYALAHLLAPGAFARYPLIHRIMGLQTSGPGLKSIPTTFLYGDSDWMDVKGGYAAVERLSGGAVTGSKVNANSYGADGSKVIVVPRAGHNLFIDAHDSFNKSILDELKDVTRASS